MINFHEETIKNLNQSNSQLFGTISQKDQIITSLNQKQS
jgi:hypothetical protein